MLSNDLYGGLNVYVGYQLLVTGWYIKIGHINMQ
jgi:hypothetical protein